jgi:hypothetical protein
MIKPGDTIQIAVDKDDYPVFKDSIEVVKYINVLVLATDNFRIQQKLFISSPGNYGDFAGSLTDRYLLIRNFKKYKDYKGMWIDEEIVSKLIDECPDGWSCDKCKDFFQFAEPDDDGNFICFRCANRF